MEPSEHRDGQRRLRDARLERGWTQQMVADHVGTTVVTVKRWERGAQQPGPYFRLKLVQLFGKSEQELGLLPTDENVGEGQEEVEAAPEQHVQSDEVVMTDRDDTVLAEVADEDTFSTNPVQVSQGEQEHVLRDGVAAAVGVPVASDALPHQRDLSVQSQFNRRRMIELVENIWINGMLQQSLHGATLLALGLREEPQLVANPWRLALQEMEQPAHLLAAGTTITQVYDTTHGQLLILGEPGAGKTTLLLELTRDLLERARRDSTHPIPVVFNLSSWAANRRSLADWLVEELNAKYQVPRSLGKEWIASDVVLPLLDGLDEVSMGERAACVEAINRYRQEHGLLPMVVCSRSEDYLAQQTRVQLRNSVVLQSLTKEQIQEYLSCFGEAVEGLAQALQEDEELQVLAATPLMLNILTLAYQDKAVEDLLLRDPRGSRRSQVFAHYVERMLHRRSGKRRYSAEKTKYWLIWLAKQLKQQQQTEFYIEGMQFDWLRTGWVGRMLPGMGLGIIYGLLIGLVFALFNGLFYGVRAALCIGGTLAVCNAVLYELLNVVVVAYNRQDGLLKEARGNDLLVSRALRPLVPLLEKRMIYGSIFVVFNGLLCGLVMSMLPEMGMELYYCLEYGSIYGFLIGCAYGLQGRPDLVIRPAEVIRWSWQATRRNAGKFGAIGIVVGLVFGFFYPWYVKIALVLFISASAIAIGGISNKALERRQRQRPNQGIWRSARNSVLTGAAVAIFTWGFLGGVFGLFYGPLTGLLYGSVPGLAVGICMGLYQGGTAWCLHAILRLQLWFSGCAPWNYPHFLNEAAERILLRKIGGGYVFVHRYLLEYFAGLDVEYHEYERRHEEGQRTARRALLVGSTGLVVGGVVVGLNVLPKFLAPSPGTLLYIYMKHSKWIDSVDIAPDGRTVVSSGEDGTARVWDAVAGTDLFVIRGVVTEIQAVAWSPDGQQIALGNNAPEVQIWDIRKKKQVLAYEGHKGVGKPAIVRWSPDGHMIASGARFGMIQVWNAKNGKRIFGYTGVRSPMKMGMTWSPDSTSLAFGVLDVSQRQCVQVWNVAKGQCVQVLSGDISAIMDMAWSPDGRYLAAGLLDGRVYIWNMLKGDVFAVYRVDASNSWSKQQLLCTCWSPDSKYLLTGGTYGAEIWGVEKRRPVLTYRHHTGRVSSAAWSRNGKFIVSGSFDATVHVWTAP